MDKINKVLAQRDRIGSSYVTTIAPDENDIMCTGDFCRRIPTINKIIY